MIRSSVRFVRANCSLKRWDMLPCPKRCTDQLKPLFVGRQRLSTTSFSMEQLKDLRARSGAPIIECKKALGESDGDVEKSMDWLRRHGAAKASSKVSGRDASEGLVSCKVDPSGTMASLVLVSSETDFAGRSPAFVNLVTHAANATLASTKVGTFDDLDSILALEYESKSIQTSLEEAIVAIRENLGIKSAIRLEATADNGASVLVGYVHGRVDGSDAGSAAAVVEIAGDAINHETMQEAGKKLAMHVVAAKPEYLDPDSVPSDVIERERSVLEGQIGDSRKPPDVIEKIITGRMKKFYQTFCLTEQEHMVEAGNPKVSTTLKELGLRVTNFEKMSI